MADLDITANHVSGQDINAANFTTDATEIETYINNRNQGNAAWDAMKVSSTAANPVDVASSSASGTEVSINNTATDGDPMVTFKLSGTTAGKLYVDDSDSDKIKIGDGTTDFVDIDDGNVGINGSTGNDSQVTHKLAGTAIFSSGVDDSDSDKFKISRGAALGTNDDVVISQTSGAVAIRGTATNDSASAGFVGEYIEAKNSSNTNFPTSGQYGDANSLSLTAGDWDVTFTVVSKAATATWTRAWIGISSTSGNSSTGLNEGENFVLNNWASSSSTPTIVSATVPSYRVSIASTTPYYGKVYSEYSAGTPAYTYKLSARRVR